MSSERQLPAAGSSLRVIRQYRWLILILTIAGAVVGWGVSAVQHRVYTAEASVSVHDPTQDVALLGGVGSSLDTQDQLSAAHVAQVTRRSVVDAVSADLGDATSAGSLKRAVNVHVDPASDLVLIDAEAGDGQRAAAIANDFAHEDARLSTLQARSTYAAEAQNLASKIKAVGANNPTTRLAYVDQLSRLQSLSAVAVPIQVTSTAAVPGSPSSPKPLRNVAIGLILGLVLGFGTAYGRHALDRRLHHPDEIEEQLELPLLGYVRREALGHAGGISNGRGPVDDVDLESFRIIRQNIAYLDADSPCHCILVTSGMAEEGKSTVASGLALANAAAGKRTVLLECDLRRPVLAERMRLANGPGLTEYLAGEATPQEVLQVVAPIERTTRSGAPADSLPEGAVPGVELVCITAGSVPSLPAELLASRRFQSLLAELSSVYEVVILDSSPLLQVVDTLQFVPHVSALALCVRCDQTTRDQARGVRAALQRVPAKPAGVVVTAVHPGEGYYGYYEPYRYSARAA